MDGGLSGLLMGLTLQTRPEEIYRALIEATAFGTRRILDSYRDGGVAIDRIVACGGLARRNPLLVQIYADVTGRPIEVADSDQTVARGAAIFGALAAGAFSDAESAVERLGAGRDRVVSPAPSRRAAYDELYYIYLALHDHFGRDVPAQMHRLRALAAR
jgi:L-ribulokinase